jgi:hypothetical protein
MKEKPELPGWCLILKELEEEAKREITHPPAGGKNKGGEQALSTA